MKKVPLLAKENNCLVNNLTLEFLPENFHIEVNRLEKYSIKLLQMILMVHLSFGCGSMEYYRMELYEWFCVDCGTPSIDCRMAYELPEGKKVFADSFEAPLGSSSGEGYYIAQKFAEPNPRFLGRLHLGEDWNYVAGGDSDYGAPVYSIGNGLVTQAGSVGGGWGKLIRICYRLTPNLAEQFGTEYVEAVYAHLHHLQVKSGDYVGMGEWIGSVGDAEGVYTAHLHFEMRLSPGEDLGGGYDSEIEQFYIAPVKFLSYFQKRIAKESNDSTKKDKY